MGRRRSIALALFLAASAGIPPRAPADDAPAGPAPDEPAGAFELFRSRPNLPPSAAFTFVRVQYDSEGGNGEAYYYYDGREWERWETDYPEADENFVFRLAEMTVLKPNPRAETRRLTAPDLGDFPLLYMCDVGWQTLNPAEIAALRDYLLRGGMVWVDDFWGWAEWDQWENVMKKVLPESGWREIPADHPVMNVVFPVKECPQIPAKDFAMQGWRWDPPWIHKSDGVEETHFRGWFDEEGRLLVVCTHNTDIGDGFEREGEDEEYFRVHSTRAYALGVNIVVYAMTH